MKFRKKPVVVEAFQMTIERRASNMDWPEWLHEAWNKPQDSPGALWPYNGNPQKILVLATLEGLMLVNLNDYIIQGIKGELYACKPDIFEATYEACEPGEEV